MSQEGAAEALLFVLQKKEKNPLPRAPRAAW